MNKLIDDNQQLQTSLFTKFTNHNMGAADRVARLSIGTTMIFTMINSQGVLGWNVLLSLISIPIIISGIIAWDPVYALLKFRTETLPPAATILYTLEHKPTKEAARDERTEEELPRAA